MKIRSEIDDGTQHVRYIFHDKVNKTEIIAGIAGDRIRGQYNNTI